MGRKALQGAELNIPGKTLQVEFVFLEFSNMELEEKSNALQHQCPEIKWHYIGKVQSNKIGKICSSTNPLQLR
ncbi:hypothetical protein COOONC_21454 [Cooperia oncophora]